LFLFIYLFIYIYFLRKEKHRNLTDTPGFGELPELGGKLYPVLPPGGPGLSRERLFARTQPLY
jgi:hypothetical protein